jgi:hypothetical protein
MYHLLFDPCPFQRLPKGPSFPWQAAEQNMSKNRYKGIMACELPFPWNLTKVLV